MPTIRISLSGDGIRQAKEQISETKDWIRVKVKQLAEELARYGIQIAEQNTGVWGKHIEFVMETEETVTGCKAIMIMRDLYKIIPKHDDREVSPSLMAEYGAGHYAVKGWQGTFPDQIHAFNPLGWWYLGNDDKWHHSYGVVPERPMYTAYQEMIGHIDEVAKRVFT